MKKLLLVAAGLLLAGAAIAQVPGAKVSTTLSGTEYIQNQNAAVSSVFSANTLAKYSRVAAGTATALSTTSPATLTPTLGNVFTVTPTGALTINAASAPVGEYLTIVVTTSGTSSFVLTFGTNFKSTGTLATGTVSAKVFTVSFLCDGTNCNEISRTTAM